MSFSQASKSDQESSSCSSASSTLTQWPSPDPNHYATTTDDTLYLQEILDRAMADVVYADTNTITHHTLDDTIMTAATVNNNSETTNEPNISQTTKAAIQAAARHLHSCQVLLLVTGAGFSADSGLATYLDVADIDAYRKRGWRYRDLCRPLQWGEGVMEGQEVACSSRGDKSAVPQCEEGVTMASHPSTHYPDEEDIRHPQYFYGFWGQCINDYRKVGPHEGYDIIARWGRDKNLDRRGRGGDKRHADVTDANAKDEGVEESHVAREIRRITQKLERRSRLSSSSSAATDDNASYNHSVSSSHCSSQEPYHVSTQRAGAFFFFTSNVDAHSYDVFQSHEIRECHGNTELWQCRNFACGTNDTSMEGFATSIDEELDGEKKEKDARPKNWERRLWRLPLDHMFEVDPVTMSAPPTKGRMRNGTKTKKQFELTSKSEVLFVDSPLNHSRSSTAKRQKSESIPVETECCRAENDNEDATGVLSYFQHQFATVEDLDSTNNHHADESVTAPA
eukprot:CCRYP_011436-RB/>CCRYP_011436-RB protein AED:0.16 eAED:0.16 QI:34/-1/0/1/-1/1/1/0/508